MSRKGKQWMFSWNSVLIIKLEKTKCLWLANRCSLFVTPVWQEKLAQCSSVRVYYAWGVFYFGKNYGKDALFQQAYSLLVFRTSPALLTEKLIYIFTLFSTVEKGLKWILVHFTDHQNSSSNNAHYFWVRTMLLCTGFVPHPVQSLLLQASPLLFLGNWLTMSLP